MSSAIYVTKGHAPYAESFVIKIVRLHVLNVILNILHYYSGHAWVQAWVD